MGRPKGSKNKPKISPSGQVIPTKKELIEMKKNKQTKVEATQLSDLASYDFTKSKIEKKEKTVKVEKATSRAKQTKTMVDVTGEEVEVDETMILLNKKGNFAILFESSGKQVHLWQRKIYTRKEVIQYPNPEGGMLTKTVNAGDLGAWNANGLTINYFRTVGMARDFAARILLNQEIMKQGSMKNIPLLVQKVADDLSVSAQELEIRNAHKLTIDLKNFKKEVV